MQKVALWFWSHFTKTSEWCYKKHVQERFWVSLKKFINKFINYGTVTKWKNLREEIKMKNLKSIVYGSFILKYSIDISIVLSSWGWCIKRWPLSKTRKDCCKGKRLWKKMLSSYHMESKKFIGASFTNDISTEEKVLWSFYFWNLWLLPFRQSKNSYCIVWYMWIFFGFIEKRRRNKYYLWEVNCYQQRSISVIFLAKTSNSKLKILRNT